MRTRTGAFASVTPSRATPSYTATSCWPAEATPSTFDAREDAIGVDAALRRASRSRRPRSGPQRLRPRRAPGRGRVNLIRGTGGRPFARSDRPEHLASSGPARRVPRIATPTRPSDRGYRSDCCDLHRAAATRNNGAVRSDLRRFLLDSGASEEDIDRALAEGWLPLLALDRLATPGRRDARHRARSRRSRTPTRRRIAPAVARGRLPRRARRPRGVHRRRRRGGPPAAAAARSRSDPTSRPCSARCA